MTNHTGPASRETVLAYAFVCAGTLGLAVCATMLFLTMRAIMAMGTGFVAAGGPYEIAYPAPGWIWVLPASILSGVGFIGLHWAGAIRLSGFTIILPMWIALFFALGANFLEFGIRSTGSGGVAWIVCGVVFWAMAAMPLFAPLLARNNPSVASSWMAFPAGDMALAGHSMRTYAVVHVLAAMAGVAAGLGLFSLLA